MQERAFGGEAGTERDHDTPVALARLSVLEHLVQHEQYSGRRQIAESTQYLARVDHLVVRELQVSLRPLKPPPTCRVQDPELHVFPSETVVLEDAFRELRHHDGSDAPHVLAQAHPGSSTWEREAHAVEVFGSDDCPVTDERPAVALRPQHHRPGP